MKLFPDDLSGFEKVVYIFVIVLLGFMYLSAFGVFHNFYSVACAAAGWGWKVLGFALLGGAAYYYKLLIEERASGLVWLGVLVVLSLASMCGFSYPYNF